MMVNPYQELDALAHGSSPSNRLACDEDEQEIQVDDVLTSSFLRYGSDSVGCPAARRPPRPHFAQQYQQMQQQNPHWLFCLARHCLVTALDLYAASKVYCLHLVNLETLLVAVVAATTTTLYYVYGREHLPQGQSYGANIQWTIVTFAVISPMIMQIRQAFTRREQALDILAEVKGLFVNILLANVLWDWGKNGRHALPKNFDETSKAIVIQMVRDLEALLSLPTLTRGRHRLTQPGKRFVDKWSSLTTNLQLQLVAGMRRLHEQVEVMKSHGLPPNEASRINQYHWMLSGRIERLQNIKFYRTPQATRSFTRLFILVLPVFYGPYYVFLMNPDPHHTLPFAFALCLSVVTSLTMIGVFNVERAMEDPFTTGLDCIRLEEMMSQLEHSLDMIGSPPSNL